MPSAERDSLAVLVRKHWIALLLLFAFALLLRLVCFTGIIGSDDIGYGKFAQQIANGTYRLVLHHYAIRYGVIVPLGAIYRVFGVHEWKEPAVFVAGAIILWCSIRLQWKLAAAVLAGVLLVIGGEFLWYYSQTGDLMFRAHAMVAHNNSPDVLEEHTHLAYRVWKQYPRMMIPPNVDFGLHSVLILACGIGAFAISRAKSDRSFLFVALWAVLPFCSALRHDGPHCYRLYRRILLCLAHKGHRVPHSRSKATQAPGVQQSGCREAVLRVTSRRRGALSANCPGNHP
jgi:hypothetical protein